MPDSSPSATLEPRVHLPPVGTPVVDMDGPVLVFGGCYGNLEATAAVLGEAVRLNIPPERMVCTGDVVAYCADAVATVRLIRESGIHVVMGNCEESLGFGSDDCGCGFAEGSTCEQLSTAWYAYADAQLDPASRAWMRALPRRIDIRLASMRLAVVHGGVDQINRFLFESDSDSEFSRQLDLAECDGVIAGHCGLPFTRQVGRRLWHNAGAIGMPANDGTSRTWYSLVEPVAQGLAIRHRPLVFDHRGAAQKMERAKLPSGYAEALLTGLWPSCDVLPAVELGRRGTPIAEQSIVWTPQSAPAIAGPMPGAAARIDPLATKFTDAVLTASGARRAVVPLSRLKTLWFNTGTLCNLACEDCYIESSPRNDRLVYLARQEARRFLNEAIVSHPELEEIGFTGGEPFMNPDVLPMMEDALQAGFRVLVLTNAMKPMQRLTLPLLDLHRRFPGRIAVRVSVDHYRPEKHEQVRGDRTWQPTIDGLLWLAANGFDLAVAGRMVWPESEAALRAGYRSLYASLDIALDADDPTRTVLFPDLDDGADVPEISESCWGILGKTADSVMCASSRMVVHRKGAERASVVACTLLPYDERFELGETLADGARPVSLNHRHCSKFCVLGGASCSRAGK